MICMVCVIGVGYGCSCVLLVSNDNCVVSWCGKCGWVYVDYDVFWQELGVVRCSDGDYELLCEEMVLDL